MAPTKQELRDTFVGDVQRINNLYSSLSGHATDPEKSVLAEQTVVSLTVALESFISELLFTLISEQPDRYLTNLSQAMKKALLKANYSHAEIKYLEHGQPKKLAADELGEIILNDGDNLAFPETRMLKEFVRNNLPGSLVFEIVPEDIIFVDLLKSTRNLCAHHSQKAARILSGAHKKHFHDRNYEASEVCQNLVQEEDITIQNIGLYLKEHNLDSSYRDRIEYVAIYLRGMVFRWVR